MTDSDTIAKAKRLIAECRLASPLIMAALPAHDAPPLAAREIADKVELCTLKTARHVLNALVKVGVASVELVPCHRGGSQNVYRLRGNPDDFEDSPNMYAAEVTEGEDA